MFINVLHYWIDYPNPVIYVIWTVPAMNQPNWFWVLFPGKELPFPNHHFQCICVVRYPKFYPDISLNFHRCFFWCVWGGSKNRHIHLAEPKHLAHRKNVGSGDPFKVIEFNHVSLKILFSKNIPLSSWFWWTVSSWNSFVFHYRPL